MHELGARLLQPRPQLGSILDITAITGKTAQTRELMNQIRYQAFLLTRILQRNDYGSVPALLTAIETACAIPESEWGARKRAFNAIGEKAPLRNNSDLAVVHSDIPAFLEREWAEFNAFSAMTKNVSRPADLKAVLQRFWLTDADMASTDPAFNPAQAIREGWVIIDGDEPELRLVAASGVFQSDGEAWRHVFAQAQAGSEYHTNALEYLRQRNPEEHAALMKSCGQQSSGPDSQDEDETCAPAP